MIVGIDPGHSGAIALLCPSLKIELIDDMPMMVGPKGKSETNYHQLASLLAPTHKGGRDSAVIEQVGAMPRQGVSSMFRFGQNFGAIKMALAGHGYETHFVTPAVWKKHFKLSSDKGASRGYALRRFPALASQLSRVKDDGRAEALLIALYGQEVLGLT